MRAISSSTAFAPALAEILEQATHAHHSEPSAACGGCLLAAEGALVAAMRRWEWFVKELLIDLMTGAQTTHPNGPHSTSNFPQPNRLDARRQLLRTRYSAHTSSITLKRQPAQYLLLHSPTMVAATAAYWLRDSSVEAVFRGCSQDIERLLQLRHGLAHGTPQSQKQSRDAMMALDPLTTFSSMGEFLLAPSTVAPTSWLEFLLDSLVQWSVELSP
ncbi:hypothetical protein AB0K00_04160 [Dactylosporangium sp. NPDC049525]|uniref:hypothetical protein n=1 Tax=Dactylosporangium sp. NPDC049525 TaxID=3154730 RepID=UPI00341C509A